MARTIGTKFEYGLHRDLKFKYAGRNGRVETEVAGFVADGINAKGEYIEVQTSNFARFKKKVLNLVEFGKIKIIYPVIITKHIEVFDTDGKRLYRRKSPHRGCKWDLFNVLVHAPELPLIPGVTIELALVDADEKRVKDNKGSWRRKGVSIRDRILTAFHECIRLKKTADYLKFVPFSKKESFTSVSFGIKAGIDINLARKTLYVLARIGIVEKTGKQRNTLVYRRADTTTT